MTPIPHRSGDYRRVTADGTVTAFEVASRLHGDRHRLGLMLGRTDTTLRLNGEIDIAAVDDLNTLLEQLETISMTVTVDMVDVTFIDSSGIAPLVETTRLRDQAGLGGLRIGARSRQAQFFLNVIGIGGNPHLDVEAWERLMGGPAG